MYVSDCILIMVVSYALGSVPFGVVFAKLFGLPDPRTIGSGNIGATNMLRTGNKKVALLTLLFDAGKGALAVILAATVFTEANAGAALAGLLATIGHMYSPWLRFKGGKGMATILGAVLAFSWPVGLTVMAIWLAVFLPTRYVSLASIAALAAIPLLVWLTTDAACGFILGVAAGIAIWRHRENITRLCNGVEPKMKRRSKDNA